MLGSTSSTSGKSDAAGPAGTSRTKVKCFPSSVQNGPRVLFSQMIVFFSQLNFPFTLEARNALAVVAQGLFARAQQLNSKDVVFRTSLVS